MASRDLALCVEELRNKVPLIIDEYHQINAPYIIKIICTLRSTQEQQELYAKGRTTPGNIVTYKDGVTSFGAHNPTPTQPLSRAVDFGVFRGKDYITQNTYYSPLGPLAEKYGLVWGGSWETFKDTPHIETKDALI
jgi:peptidoglycan L-alanyl-D-glutamate endopeptidase CwlK